MEERLLRSGLAIPEGIQKKKKKNDRKELKDSSEKQKSTFSSFYINLSEEKQTSVSSLIISAKSTDLI